MVYAVSCSDPLAQNLLMQRPSAIQAGDIASQPNALPNLSEQWPTAALWHSQHGYCKRLGDFGAVASVT